MRTKMEVLSAKKSDSSKSKAVCSGVPNFPSMAVDLQDGHINVHHSVPGIGTELLD